MKVSVLETEMNISKAKMFINYDNNANDEFL